MKNFLFSAAAALVFLTAQGAAARETKAEKAEDVTKAEESTKHIPSVKAGGLLNTDVTPEQAKKTAEATNRQVMRQRKQGTGY